MGDKGCQEPSGLVGFGYGFRPVNASAMKTPFATFGMRRVRTVLAWAGWRLCGEIRPWCLHIAPR